MKFFSASQTPIQIAAAWLIALCLIATPAAQAQEQELKFPPLSSEQTVTQSLGLSTISLKYARPSVRDRQIFGGLIPYGEVWRTGANGVTTITFEHAMTLGGQVVEAGTYALLTIPGQQEWAIILNSNTQQWGASKYNQEEDILRLTDKVEPLPQLQETFRISFEDVSLFSANLVLSWEHTAVRIPMTVNQQSDFEEAILQAMRSEGTKPYFRAAMYYYNMGKDKKQALEWITQAVQEKPDLYYMQYWKGVIELELNDRVSAKATAQTGLKLAEAASAAEYVRRFNELLKKVQ